MQLRHQYLPPLSALGSPEGEDARAGGEEQPEQRAPGNKEEDRRDGGYQGETVLIAFFS